LQHHPQEKGCAASESPLKNGRRSCGNVEEEEEEDEDEDEDEDEEKEEVDDCIYVVCRKKQ
jgi:hypothetical protein